MKISELFNISGKVAVVTGGSRGIGEMISAGFLANGVKVYITARKEEPLVKKAEELSNKYNGVCILPQKIYRKVHPKQHQHY